jgi:TetR/AcrR family transcriptional regulator, transcriptional repressor for nem operon
MVRYKQEQKEQTREKIIAAAGRCFRKDGYRGIGVDGLAKEAGVTSGAFYGHFDSKKSAFEAAVIAGITELRSAIASLQEQYGKTWWQEFAKFYMSHKRTCDLSESCALQTLSPELGRADESLRAVFEVELMKVINQADSASSREKTLVNLAMLIGGVTLARAVHNESLANEIAAAIENAVIAKN